MDDVFFNIKVPLLCFDIIFFIRIMQFFQHCGVNACFLRGILINLRSFQYKTIACLLLQVKTFIRLNWKNSFYGLFNSSHFFLSFHNSYLRNSSCLFNDGCDSFFITCVCSCCDLLLGSSGILSSWNCDIIVVIFNCWLNVYNGCRCYRLCLWFSV